ncbi:MAG: hypothetical protein COU90_00790 [Candidatus Ryanbacteria bacterium CG10_big_fil_rev_8_21_14_0_10_43_42]|uniref:Galactose-1-phosphate uridyl transferase N-terminal domain-containing protein n=1 Tax=Candidatus Ryanbacteria bacterium CG10_big_fil_rev_8_21_14_0_10_43_42 TaxID=1974864 RepID=A0A2M8KXY0_9BACT|nr:MAG: hypothetical protein COU90_00790 [Candidatus Ryanbacteria bacterium CG10_big_fil_rev_8_21_14_0_10_43_42]
MLPEKKEKTHRYSELRQDIVSGEWVLIATGRAKRPDQYASRSRQKPASETHCPFEGPRINDKEPILWYPHPESNAKDNFDDWFVQVVENLYPAVTPHEKKTCAIAKQDGLYNTMSGIGYHELIITRPHERSLGEMTPQEAALVVRSYRERYMALGDDECVAYILVFHNHGHEAGASISHPHSQLVALPIVPPDVQRSFHGSAMFYKKFKTCIHCQIIHWERKQKSRIVYENDTFLVITPYAPHGSFELRIYPKEHASHFKYIPEESIEQLGDALSKALGMLHRTLKDPAYNFFIHTTPENEENTDHYHWHFELLPKISTPAGLELGTGLDVIAVAPEQVPGLLNDTI